MKTQTIWGVRAIDEALSRPSTIRIGASGMTLEGFADDTKTEYRRRSVVRMEPGGSIRCAAPDCGRRYLGFVIYDQLDTETVEIWIDGVKEGVAVADGNNQRERLITFTEPYDFRGGEEIRLRTPTGERAETDPNEWITRGPPMEMSPYGNRDLTGRHLNEVGEEYRIECIAFFTESPPENDLPCNFDYVHAEPEGALDEGRDTKDEAAGSASVRLTWVTTWDARCKLEYWVEGSRDHKVIEEDHPWTNHRIKLTELVPEKSYRYRLSAVDRAGKVVESEKGAFVTASPPTVTGNATSEHIPLTIRNDGDSPYRRLPMRCGLPLPEGTLGSSGQVRLMGSNGSEIPLQARTLARWPDGSVKWSLLEFQADVPAGAEEAYSVEFGSEVSPGRFDTPLTVRETDDTVTVDTGRLKITFNRSRFAPFGEVLLDNRPYLTGSRLVVKGPEGREYVSTNAAPASVEVEEAGPMACVVRTEGDHVSADGKTLFRSICRIHAYAGLPYVRVDHTFVNNTLGEFSEIASMYLELDQQSEDHEEIDIVQTHDNRFLVDGEASRGRQEGMIRVGDVDVGMVDFWQQYPKSVRAHKGRIEIGICPAVDASDYDDDAEQYRLYFYLKGGIYRFREGLSKTHTMYIGEDVPSLPLPIAQAPPNWYCDSGALGDIASKSEKRFADYEAKITEACEGYVGIREGAREYGMLNFGDWERPPNWGNTEYDTGFVMLREWARSGDVRWFEEGCRAALHHRDVDTCHASGDEMSRGGVYRHCVGHTGGYYPEGLEIAGASVSGQLTVSHTWVDGFLLHYFLTGDARSLETARMAADRWDSHYTRNYDFINCRNNGWHLIHSMGMYYATYDRFYLNAAHIVADRTLERQDEDGGWSRMLVPGHCNCDPPRHMGEAGFMIGILLEGLRLYHQATGDGRVAEAIIRGAQHLIDDMWLEEEGYFRYTSCPHRGGGNSDMGQILAGISYAWRLSGRPQFESVLSRGTPRMFNTLDPSGRPLTPDLRGVPEILYDRGLSA